MEEGQPCLPASIDLNVGLGRIDYIVLLPVYRLHQNVSPYHQIFALGIESIDLADMMLERFQHAEKLPGRAGLGKLVMTAERGIRGLPGSVRGEDGREFLRVRRLRRKAVNDAEKVVEEMDG